MIKHVAKNHATTGDLISKDKTLSAWNFILFVPKIDRTITNSQNSIGLKRIYGYYEFDGLVIDINSHRRQKITKMIAQYTRRLQKEYGNLFI